jgi:tRNA(fMet)-specific endonuclease VapC
MKYLLDSDSINFALRRDVRIVARLTSAVSGGSQFVLSPVVDFEVRRYLLLKGFTRRLREYSVLCAGWERGTLSNDDWETATGLWVRRHRAGAPIADADLLVAVSALKAGAILVTGNGRHFRGLGLTIEDWGR